MSHCEIITFKDGKPAEYIEFRNAWGGAARVWESLYDLYLKDPAKEYDCWLNDKEGRLWKLIDDGRLPFHAKAVFASTFDRALVTRESFKRYTEDLRLFDSSFPAGEDRVNHLPSWASSVEEVMKDSEVQAIGFLGTSVGEDLFQDWDEETEEDVPYDLNKEDRHFLVYEWLDSKEKES